MAPGYPRRGGNGDKPAIVLDLLSAIERDSKVTQRSLSSELGIALGMANAYLRRCVNKGLVKVRQAPLNRYAYYLTPSGFAEKSRLTAEYLSLSFRFFRDARQQFADLYAGLAARGSRRVILAGAGELAEIAVLAAQDAGFEVPAIVGTGNCAGCAIASTLAETLTSVGPADAVIVTDMHNPQAMFERIRDEAAALGMPVDRVLAPPMLRISRSGEAAVIGEGSEG